MRTVANMGERTPPLQVRSTNGNRNGNKLTREQHQTVLALGECLFQLRTTRDRIRHLARSSEKQIDSAYDALVQSADGLFAANH
jgi:hypothetical protein